MATRHATGGLAHPTVVPENFEPDDETASERDTAPSKRDTARSGTSADADERH